MLRAEVLYLVGQEKVGLDEDWLIVASSIVIPNSKFNTFNAAGSGLSDANQHVFKDLKIHNLVSISKAKHWCGMNRYLSSKRHFRLRID